MKIREATHGIISTDATVAHGVIDRMVGLLCCRSLLEGRALIIPRCNAIHTWFMRFPIDVVFLNMSAGWKSLMKRHAGSSPILVTGTVVKAFSCLRPFRMVGAFGSHLVIEFPNGTVLRRSIQPGTILQIEEKS